MPVENCEHCGGTGYRIVERDGISAASWCECNEVGKPQRMEDGAGIPDLYRAASLDNFVLPVDNPIARNQLGSVLLQVRAFVREYPVGEKQGLLFIGDPGTGKTHLAVATLRALIARGFEGVFFDYQNLLQRIRSSYDKASELTDREAYRSALDAEILLLDDLGAHRTTDWVEDTVTAIITHRCNHKRPLIATTNLADGDAGTALYDKDSARPSGHSARITLGERIGMRARSRLFEMCRIVKMPAVEDYRIRRAKY
jgi:DNA replication protein DnaC